MKEMSKAYDPSSVEDAIYAAWEKSGFFNPDTLPGKRARSFSIVLPPPNVTGILHLGHAVMLAVQDLMIRFERMRGAKALWLPGTDHAAIATQTKVEKLLKEKTGKTRHDLGREAFLREVEKFVNESKDTIHRQIRKMGSSCDWSREAYTLDEPRTLAVRTVFKMMHKDGLIYRGNRIVNWCPQCASTLADDEVEYKPAKEKLYWIKYGPFVLATSRPETKLGDTAVAVHPDDPRYKKHVGKKYMIPGVLGEFEVVVVADPVVDMKFGSGVIKVTPAHDFTDFEIAQRHGVTMRQVIGEDGKMMPNTGKYAGMTTAEARAEIVKDMDKVGLIEKIEDYDHNLSVCYRCEHVIEPLPKLQWFINVTKEFPFRQSKRAPIKGLKNGQKVTLKKLMQHVVRTEQIEIIPDRFVKTYFHWIDNLRDWNISRQIWFGHQVPVWYRGTETHVGVEPPKGEGWTQDPDTLDTWFSSGLWTFSTIGWPKATKDIKTFHPTSVMETGYDILFFWIARMILMTTYALGEVPFRTVYLHGLVRDEQGRKMSKSLGNIIDPLDVAKKYGTDAVRLSLLIGTAPGADSRVWDEKIAGYRNFTNKLWNIARFILGTRDRLSAIPYTLSPKTLADRWILGRYAAVVKSVTSKLERFEFSSAGEELRDFTWNEFADWYLEISKIQKNEGILSHILDGLLRLWHPFMPFITEAIWEESGGKNLLMIEAWPVGKGKADAKTQRDFALVQDVVSAIRNIRADYRVPPSKTVDAIVSAGMQLGLLRNQSELICHLARISTLTVEQKAGKPVGAVGAVVRDMEVFVPLSGMFDLEKGKARLKHERDDLAKYVSALQLKLEDAKFTGRAPALVVESERTKLAEAKERLSRTETQIASIK